MSTEAPVLVTGAASGIGAAVLQLLRERSVPAIGWDLRPNETCYPHPVDIRDEEAVDAAVAALPDRLSGVINCAGIGLRGTLLEHPVEAFRRVIDVNVVGTAAVARAAHSRLRPGGVFVAVGSVAGTVPLAKRSAYCASKAAVAMLAACLASEWTNDHIQVLCVSPGFVAGGMAVDGSRAGATNLEHVLARTPTRSLVPMEDLTEILFLAATGKFRSVSGSEIVVDGGFVAGSLL